MRKKSHISLARDIVRHSGDTLLRKHKWAFYLGSILPDLQPSFLYRKHEFGATFGRVKRRIVILASPGLLAEGRETKYYRDLGQVTHYIADYFTFPHNEVYPGTLKEHCVYEGELKDRLVQYLKDGQESRECLEAPEFSDSENLCDFVQEKHEEYLRKEFGIDGDIEHIVSLNYQVVEGIKQLVGRNFEE